MQTLNVTERASLAERYARGLYRTCRRPERVVEIADQMRQLSELMEENKEFNEAVLNPLLSARVKLSIVVRILPEVDELLLRLLNFLLVRRRISFFPQISKKFEYIAEKERGLATIVAVLPTDVDPFLRERLTIQIGIWLRTEAQIRFEVDPSIMGGLKLQMGDWIYDGSVTKQLELARRAFVERRKAHN